MKITSWKGVEGMKPKLYSWDFSLPSRCSWGLCASRMLRGVAWQLVTDVSGQPVGPLLKGSLKRVSIAVPETSEINSFWYISNKMQFYTVYLFLGNCSTCFGWYLHPSSGTHVTVFTVSGTC